MALQVNITNISQVTYPVDVYVCRDCPNVNCTLVDTINSVPASITIPSPYDTYPLFGVKIIDAKDCEYCQIFQSGTTTTSSTSTSSTSTSTTLNPICESCDIGFDFYDTNPIAEISVGLVTASCDPSVTDYIIEWYGPGIGSTTVAFTSGYGTDYTGDYLYTHPLTGSSAVPVVAGIYTPIIQKIKLNGIEYTDLNCFNSTTVDVDALTCDNGPGSTNPYYSHGISFSATTSITPQPVITTFVLDPTKPYFAYSFKGEQIYDDLKITFFGSNYPVPIVLEYISMGQNTTVTDFSLNLTPKTIRSNSQNALFPKVLCLTGLTVNSGDYLEIEVTPNPINNNTNWSFFCECLETFDCEICYNTAFQIPVKLKTSSLSSVSHPCNGFSINFQLSGCSDSNIFRYLNPNSLLPSIVGVDYNSGIGPFLYSPSINLATPILYSNASTTCFKTSVNTYSKICDAPTTDTIDYTKTIFGGEGLITMNFTNYSDLEHYKNNWDYFYTNFAGSPANPLDVDYYRYFILSIPLATGSQQCGDLVGYQDYFIHPSAVVTTGGTGPWSMSITMPTISNGLTWDSCDVNCSAYTIDIVNEINVSSTSLGNAISITTNTGSKLEYPFWSRKFLNSGDTSFSSVTYNKTLSIPKYVNETIPYSGSPLTIIPSLSAQTCDLSSYFWGNSGSTTNLSNYVKNYYYYNFRVISNTGDFEIWSYDVANNPLFVPPLIKIYENIGGVPNIIDPSYFV